MASHSENSEFGFQIAPMLDILFVLLLFFMVSAGLQKHEAAISTPLPGQGPAGPLVQVSIEITSDGQVIFNGVATDTPAGHQLPETMARLKAAVADAPNRPIIISPASGTRHQRVIDVLNACVAVQVKNVTFGALAD
jgi:biopolymer transport protein ExbD